MLTPTTPSGSPATSGCWPQVPADTIVHRARFLGPALVVPQADALAGRSGLSPSWRSRPGTPTSGRWCPTRRRRGWRPPCRPASGSCAGARSTWSCRPRRRPPRTWSAEAIASGHSQRPGSPTSATPGCANPHRDYEKRRRPREAGGRSGAWRARSRRRAARWSAATERDRRGAGRAAPEPPRITHGDRERRRLRRLRGARLRGPATRFTIVHAGAFFGQRTPRPVPAALRALLDRRPELRGRLLARFVGRPARRQTASGRAGSGSTTPGRRPASCPTATRSPPSARPTRCCC